MITEIIVKMKILTDQVEEFMNSTSHTVKLFGGGKYKETYVTFTLYIFPWMLVSKTWKK